MRFLPFSKGKNGFQFAGGGVTSDSGGGGGGSYTLPTATVNRLGGVKIGSGVTVSEDGTITVSGGGGGGTLTQRTETITSASNIHDVATIPVETNKTYIITCYIGYSNNETTQIVLAKGDTLDDYEIYAEGKSHVSLAFTSRFTGNLHLWSKQKMQYSGNTETCNIDVFTF